MSIGVEDRVRATLRDRDLSRVSPLVLGALAGLSGPASVWMLRRGVGQSSAGEFIRWVAVGAGLGAFALLCIGTIVRYQTLGWTPSTRLRWAAIIASGGLIVTGIGLWQARFWVALPGLMVLIGAVLLGVHGARTLPFGSPVGWLAAGAGAASLGALLLWTCIPPVVAVALMLGGMAVFKFGVGSWLRGPAADDAATWAVLAHARARTALAWSAGAVLTGIVIAGLGGSDPLVITGIALLLFGLSSGAHAALYVRPEVWTSGRGRPVLAVAAACVGAVLALWGRTVLDGVFPAWGEVATLLALLAAFAGAFFVLRGEMIVTLVLLGALFGWVMESRSVDVSETRVEESLGTVVALGDSFMAAQGADEYLAGTNSQAPDGTMCRRGTSAFAFLVAHSFERNLETFACNGAEIYEVAELPGGRTVADDQKTQLERLRAAMKEGLVDDPDATPDLVLISVVGNDVEFSTAVVACLLPGSCADWASVFLRLATVVEAELVELYGAIRDAVGADVPIVIVPYPSYVGTAPCVGEVSIDEVRFANRLIEQINTVTERAYREANDAHLHFFDEIDVAYAGRTWCDSDRGANFLHLMPPDEGPVWARLNPLRWYDGSAHPNPLGHRCTAVILSEWLFEQGLLTADGEPPAVIDSRGCGERSDQRAAAASAKEERSELLAALPVELQGDLTGGEVALDGVRGRGVCLTPASRYTPCFWVDEWAGERGRSVIAPLAFGVGMSMLGGLLLALFVVRAWPTSRLLSPIRPVPEDPHLP